MKTRLPLSGYEPVFTWAPWGTEGKNVDNCYAYAVGDHEKFRLDKSVPGYKVHIKNNGLTYKSCKGLAKRVLADNPKKVYKVNPCVPCRKNFYKIMMFVAPHNIFNNKTGDFHFYKQHGYVDYKLKKGDTRQKIARFFKIPVKNVPGTINNKGVIKVKANVWSHKQGWGAGPLLVDAKGKAILDPRKADRKYAYDYSKFCSSFCVKNRGMKVS
jgi:hypothetical protein